MGSGNDNEKTTRFSDWEDCTTVDCNECDHWWRNDCDGVSRAQERPCTAFKATRSVVIPQKIKSLQSRLKWLTKVVAILMVAQLLTIGLVGYLMILLGG